MDELQSINFSLNGKNYQIIVFKSENGFTVRSFQNNQVVTPSYSISYEIEQDMAESGPEPFQNLIDLVISDIRHI